MQQIHSFDAATALQIAGGVRAMVLAATDGDMLATAIRALGATVEVETELYAGLSALIDDPAGYGLLVIDCDAMGGPLAGERAVRALQAEGARAQVVLISRAFPRQVFSDRRGDAVQLRGPATALSLRVGIEHALRDRLFWSR